MITLEEFLKETTSHQKILYYELEKGIRGFSNFSFIINKTCISFKAGNKKNICSIAFENRSNIAIYTNLSPNEFSDPKNMVLKHNAYGRNSRFYFRKVEELGNIINLLQQSYKKNRD